MHRVGYGSDSLTIGSNYTTRSQVASAVTPSSTTTAIDDNAAHRPIDPQAEKQKPRTPVHKRFYKTAKEIMFSSWVNCLLLFVPAGVAAHFASIHPTWIFVANAIAIVPLARLLSFATESVAHGAGDTLGAFLNVSFGNAVELIIEIALTKGQIQIVQASLLGSILANVLLILGMAIFIGGLHYREQLYNNTMTQMAACLLCLAVLSLLIPTAFYMSFDKVDAADDAVIHLSRGTSVILLVVYIFYLLFHLRSHTYMYGSIPQHILDEESHPGILKRTNSSSADRLSVNPHGSSPQNLTQEKLGDPSRGTPTEKTDLASKGLSQNQDCVSSLEDRNDSVAAARAPTKVEETPPPFAASRPQLPGPLSPSMDHYALPFRANEHPNELRPADSTSRPTTDNTQHLHMTALGTGPSPQAEGQELKATEAVSEPPISRTSSLILLIISTTLVALCAEFMVGSVNSLVIHTNLSEAFLGLIILPIVGNAAEHITAVSMAAKNKMDLAIGVAIGSSIQIALFVTPVIVLIGWIIGQNMVLYFSVFETVALFIAIFVVNFLVLDGRSNYLEGLLLCASYFIIAIAAFYIPKFDDQSVFIDPSPKLRGRRILRW